MVLDLASLFEQEYAKDVVNIILQNVPNVTRRNVIW